MLCLDTRTGCLRRTWAAKEGAAAGWVAAIPTRRALLPAACCMPATTTLVAEIELAAMVVAIALPTELCEVELHLATCFLVTQVCPSWRAGSARRAVRGLTTRGFLFHTVRI